MFDPLVNKGEKLYLYQRSLLRKYTYIMCIPFWLLLLGFHCIFTFPKIIKSNVSFVFLILSFVVTGLLVVYSLRVSSRWVDNMRRNNSFFAREYKKQMLVDYLADNNFLVKKIRKVDGKKEETYKLTPIWYRSDGEYDDFTFKIGNQFQDKILQIGRPIEDMFLADLVEVSRETGYVTFRYMIDVVSRRLNFEDLEVKDGKIELMKGLYWDFENMPHMLITGGTGGGKTYFIYSLIAMFAKVGRVHIADPKKADLAELANYPAFEGLVVSEKEDIFKMAKKMVELMDKRFLYMKQHENYTIGKNYRYYDMKPEFFIIDEWAAFISALGNSFGTEYSEGKFYEKIIPLVLKARQAGIFVIVAMQRAGSDSLRTAVRDNLLCKVSLGVLSDMGYKMTFGDDQKNKAFVNKPKVKGRGYIDVGNGTPQEFYSPFVSPDFDFSEYFRKLPEMPFTDVSGVQLTPTNKKELEKDFGEDYEKKERREKALRREEAQEQFCHEKDDKLDCLMDGERKPMAYADKIKQMHKNRGVNELDG
ncbi:cell division protein FtsK [Enterococcus faecium]|uniref:FtsK/SpoIIIE domain-containing protein n=1 Tax=Enterococcus faecium TaxID=1352 RepID=UPI000CF313E9|nr:FtsK/SpoIIIE domain-containing protein [Enterococcus faecium]PQG48413.1 cell division protein FtsK [Enterococcus faecium]